MTIKEIAKMADVSITAVSFYLNNKKNKLSRKTNERLDKIIKETGYKPNRTARDLRLQTTNKIGIIVFDIGQMFAQKIHKSISNKLKNDDYIISLYETHLNFENETRIVKSLLEGKANAIVIQPSKRLIEYLPKLVEKYPYSKTKIILIDSKGNNNNFGYISIDTNEEMVNLMKKNKEDGIKKIIYVSNEIKKLQVREDRFSQIKKHTKSLGIDFDTIITENDFSQNDDLEKLLEKDRKIKKAFWTNSAGNAFNLYSQLKTHNAENSSNTIVSFNECFFKPIVEMPLYSVDTKINRIGEEAAKQIKNNKLENIIIHNVRIKI